MSGDIRDQPYESRDSRLLPMLCELGGVTVAFCAAVYFYFDYTGPKADIRDQRYTHITMGRTEPGACGHPYTLSRHFTATDKNGEKVERLYCSSPIHGIEIREKTTLAAAEPVVSTP